MARHWAGSWERIYDHLGVPCTITLAFARVSNCLAHWPAAQRPPFPPERLRLGPAFGASLGEELGTQFLVTWHLLRSFPGLLGLRPPGAEELLQALADGQRSQLLADVHCALLRLWQVGSLHFVLLCLWQVRCLYVASSCQVSRKHP